ncbi:MAG TPA: PH domain-containing protein [Sphingobacterium sp.]|nr:PH domain-containing protein [Sphingobacterium sp.]
MKKSKFTNGINQSDVVKILRPSPIYAFASVFPMLVIAGVSLYFAVTISKLIVFVSLISIFVAAYRYLYINLIRYTITKQTITARTGIIARKFDNLELFRVKDYIVSQSVFERIFGLMTINLHTTDLSNPSLRMAGVPLSNITEIIRDLVQEARLNNRIFEIN